MKILAIIGSLRKKNTYNVVKKIEESYKDYSDVEFEYLFLKDMDFKTCKGCFTCISHGEDKCPLKDDRDKIVEKIEASDGVILASPNYVQNVSWLMKNYIDRFAYIMHRPKYFEQHFMIVISSGSYMGVKNALAALSVMSAGGKLASKLGVLNSPGMNANKIAKQEIKISREANRFYKSLSNRKRHSPSFGFLVWFSVFKASSSGNREYYPADADFYKDKGYFVDVHLSVMQKAIIKIFTKMFSILIKVGFV